MTKFSMVTREKKAYFRSYKGRGPSASQLWSSLTQNNQIWRGNTYGEVAWF